MLASGFRQIYDLESPEDDMTIVRKCLSVSLRVCVCDTNFVGLVVTQELLHCIESNDVNVI